MVFCFGSNTIGLHGAGAALVAYEKHGAKYGLGYGFSGNSFAIPTKNKYLRTLSLDTVGRYVKNFLAFAAEHPELEFQVTQIGCGLAGFQASEIAPLFKNSPANCLFDEAWRPYLKDKRYWGSF